MEPVPAVEDLIWLFEAEPRGDSDENWQGYWPYASVAFTTVRDDYTVEFSVNPGYEDAGLTLQRNGRPLATLTLTGVESVAVERLHGAEELVLRFRDSKLAALRLVLKPRVSLSWGTVPYPPEP